MRATDRGYDEDDSDFASSSLEADHSKAHSSKAGALECGGQESDSSEEDNSANDSSGDKSSREDGSYKRCNRLHVGGQCCSCNWSPGCQDPDCDYCVLQDVSPASSVNRDGSPGLEEEEDFATHWATSVVPTTELRAFQGDSILLDLPTHLSPSIEDQDGFRDLLSLCEN